MGESWSGEHRWPSTAVPVLCALVLVAGYAVAIWRGPAPAQEVRTVLSPPPAPDPAAPTE